VKALALKDGPGTDGGPLLLVPVEAVEAWEGTSSPSRPIEAKFRFGDPRAPATDYDRACDVSEQRVGVLDVGEWRGLVLGHTGCRFHVSAASCLIVMEGHGEDVAEALASSSGWTAIPGTLEVPSGKLVLFDATAARGKTREKKTLTVAPGTYTVSEFHRLKPWLWIARLSRSGGDGGTTKAASPAKKTARRK
jgi:hypothetical protein